MDADEKVWLAVIRVADDQVVVTVAQHPDLPRQTLGVTTVGADAFVAADLVLAACGFEPCDDGWVLVREHKDVFHRMVRPDGV